ncbi:phage tail protein [Cellvibrio japonicus]|uniref:Microcystin dependent protein MdpB n=1 Tax=Cellvibrio japonicus (strain Ueda107) TaxID=498211 RepID=B3PJI6_CELJU|nr:tail fiber protein [Cellvibrio japonicus]ACE84397.1 microcystin dependent protein; MdpB [Cellvibrio japonicus Ueda107]QEI11272.1 phage tail protein [Cellvibrio japonicus]QEI14846.1 phage tail protein [Cellvibrio japonicus]QEI18426.1 phage tail protein [Cellvibrio japonicus]
MSEPFYGEIRQFPYSFAPRNFSYCQGQILTIQQNAPLFSLLGTLYGGNGQTTFALPNLQGQVLMHQGSGPGLTPRTVGESSGSAGVSLIQAEMPNHNHLMVAKTVNPAASVNVAEDAYLSISRAQTAYSPQQDNLVSLEPTMLSVTGSGAAHENRQPYIAMPFCIALSGIFPVRN